MAFIVRREQDAGVPSDTLLTYVLVELFNDSVPCANGALEFIGRVTGLIGGKQPQEPHVPITRIIINLAPGVEPPTDQIVESSYRELPPRPELAEGTLDAAWRSWGPPTLADLGLDDEHLPAMSVPEFRQVLEEHWIPELERVGPPLPQMFLAETPTFNNHLGMLSRLAARTSVLTRLVGKNYVGTRVAQ